MNISEVIASLEEFAPLSLQESYDNAGLLIGNRGDTCTGILTTLDVTEQVVTEAAAKGCNLIIAHHPLIFKGLKKIQANDFVGRAVIAAIKNNIAVYAIHTNLDNVSTGVNFKIAEKLGLQGTVVLSPKEGLLMKIVTYCPRDVAEKVRSALFKAGAGHIGKYDECSFNLEGLGTFRAGEGSQPYVGNIGLRHEEPETRIEMIFPAYLESRIIDVLMAVHPYEEVAYDLYTLGNKYQQAGSGLIGELRRPLTEENLLRHLKEAFGLKVIRHTSLTNKEITRVAVCGGAGSFLISQAKEQGAHAYITSDVKYHEFFEADGSLLLADIGHFESEQFTTDLLADILRQKFSNFAVLKTEISTNPVNYFI